MLVLRIEVLMSLTRKDIERLREHAQLPTRDMIMISHSQALDLLDRLSALEKVREATSKVCRPYPRQSRENAPLEFALWEALSSCPALPEEEEAMSDLGKVCEHGSLKRQCLICELQEALAAKEAELAKYREALEKLGVCDCGNDSGHRKGHDRLCASVICKEALAAEKEKK